MLSLKRILLVEDSPRDAELALHALAAHNLAHQVLHPHPNPPPSRGREPLVLDTVRLSADHIMRNFVVQRHARALRNDATDVERHLWRWLRRRELSGFRFRRQVPIGPYVADFACLEAKVVVEVDGGQHLDRRETDQRRDREIRNRGFQVLRFWDNQVLRETQAVVEEIMRAVERHRPHPDLPPHAGEGTEGSDFPRQAGEGTEGSDFPRQVGEGN